MRIYPFYMCRVINLYHSFVGFTLKLSSESAKTGELHRLINGVYTQNRKCIKCGVPIIYKRYNFGPDYTHVVIWLIGCCFCLLRRFTIWVIIILVLKMSWCVVPIDRSLSTSFILSHPGNLFIWLQTSCGRQLGEQGGNVNMDSCFGER